MPAALQVVLGSGGVGLLTSLYLALDHITHVGKERDCDISDHISCTTVLDSEFSKILGVPVAFAGVGWHFMLLYLAVAVKTDGPVAMQALLGWCIAGCLFVAWLIAGEVILGSLCPWCTVVHITTTVACVATIRMNSNVNTSVSSLRAAAAKYWFVALVCLAGPSLLALPLSLHEENATPIVPIPLEEIDFTEAAHSPTAVSPQEPAPSPSYQISSSSNPPIIAPTPPQRLPSPTQSVPSPVLPTPSKSVVQPVALTPPPLSSATGVRALIDCLVIRRVKMYGASWCRHCKDQKEMFAKAWPKRTTLPFYVECAGRKSTACNNAKIQSYPTWIAVDKAGKEIGRLKGTQKLKTLREWARCAGT